MTPPRAGAEHTPSGLSTRFFFWVFFFSMVIVHAAYSATLVSFLAAQKVVLPFENLEGLLADGTYGLGVVNGISMYDYFKVMSRNAAHRGCRALTLVGCLASEIGNVNKK